MTVKTKKYQEVRNESDSTKFQPFSRQNFKNNSDDDSNLQEEDIPVTKTKYNKMKEHKSTS